MTKPMLQGKRIFLTQADSFVGPALCEALAAHGATMTVSDQLLPDDAAVQAALAGAGRIDVLIANLAVPSPSTRAERVGDEEWRHVFQHIVDPLPRLCRAVLPGMIERRSGKIIVCGSASALRGMRNASTYSAARGAQLAYVQALGAEMAMHQIQVNAIAANFVNTPTYFPPELQALPRFQERLKREVPLGRLVDAGEASEFIAYLCSEHANCFVGQVFPVCGGWVQR